MILDVLAQQPVSECIAKFVKRKDLFSLYSSTRALRERRIALMQCLVIVSDTDGLDHEKEEFALRHSLKYRLTAGWPIKTECEFDFSTTKGRVKFFGFAYNGPPASFFPNEQAIATYASLCFAKSHNFGPCIFADHLTHLKLHDTFNLPIYNVKFPQSLIHLEFGKAFNHSLTDLRFALPVGLETLIFGDRFNQSIDGFQWPRALKTLRFGDNFNQPIDNVEWPALVRLTFGKSFDQDLENVEFPSTLKLLRLGGRLHMAQKLVQLPDGLHLLFLGSWWPKTGQLPTQLHILSLDLPADQPVAKVVFPESLSVLSFGPTFNQSVECVRWPPKLRRLDLGKRFNQPIENADFPHTLQHLVLGPDFNQPIHAAKLPDTLKRLVLGGKFNQPVRDMSLPPSLEHLIFGEHFDQPLDDVQFPRTLTRLRFGKGFQQSLRNIQLPSALKKLQLAADYEQSLDMGFPQNFVELQFGWRRIARVHLADYVGAHEACINRWREFE